MNIVFLGNLVPPEQVSQMSGVSVAGNKFQYNMVKYLARHENIHIYVLSALPIAPFPRDKKLFIKKTQKKPWKNTDYITIPFVNIPIIKQITQICGFIACAKKLVHTNPILLSMNLYPNNGCAFLNVKRRYRLRGAAILADLPIDDNYNRKGLSKIFRQWYYGMTAQNIKRCHDFIVLNESAIIEFANQSSDYIVMEGGIDAEEVRDLEQHQKKGNKKRMIYSGALSDYSGIRELMEAMKYVTDKSVVLEIYGGGTLAGEAAEAAKKNDNIIFRGKVSNNEMLKIQSEAWLLVNPRPVDDPIARVTFPSKIFEYMTSGTPVLTTRLNGFTDGYYDKMFFVDSNEPSAIGQKISEIAMLDERELEEMARKARQFVLEEKNWQCQADKIYAFLADRM